jgi:hypothetical protein
MRYEFLNKTTPYYSEANATIGTGTGKLNIDTDWLEINAKSLTLYFYGQPGNDATKPMYVKLVDSDTPVHIAQVNYNGDMNDIKDQNNWHEWNIPLTNFTGVNLAKVAKVVIGFGIKNQASSDGRVYFDNVMLNATKCSLQERDANFAKFDYAPGGVVSGDCVIDYLEIEAMRSAWLDRDQVVATKKPDDANLVVRYPMDEGDGNRVYSHPVSLDVCDTKWTGTFWNNGVATPGYYGTTWAKHGYDGNDANCCVYMTGAQGARIQCGTTFRDLALGIGALPGDVNAITLSVWVKWLGPRYWDSYLLSKGEGILGKRGGWSDDSVIWTLWTCGCSDGRFGIGNYPAAHPDRPDVGSANNALNPFIGKWVHLAATYPNPSGTADANARARLYLNGGQLNSGPYTFAHGYDANIFLSIGNTMDQNAWTDSPESFYGYLDEVRIYNRALEPNEIAYLADKTPNDGLLWIPIPSLAEVYSEETQGNKVIDFKDYALLTQRWLTEEMYPR